MPTKKSTDALERQIEAQARGKKVGSGRNDKKLQRAGVLDDRASKSRFQLEID